MDITVTIKEGSKSIHGPETSNNLPAGVMVKYEIKLASAIKDAVVDSTKAKEIKAALSAAKWSFSDNIDDAMTLPADKALIATHKLKFKFDGKVLDKQVRCIITGGEAKEKKEPEVKVNNAAVSEALALLDKMASKFKDDITVKAGDKKHPKARQYVLKVGDEEWSGSIPDPEDSHIKESSRNTAIKDWNKNLKEFLLAKKG